MSVDGKGTAWLGWGWTAWLFEAYVPFGVHGRRTEPLGMSDRWYLSYAVRAPVGGVQNDRWVVRVSHPQRRR